MGGLGATRGFNIDNFKISFQSFTLERRSVINSYFRWKSKYLEQFFYYVFGIFSSGDLIW